MNIAQFDKYSRYLVGVALLIALLTYWRFRDIELSAVYAYVAQQDVVHSSLFQNITSTRSVVWDFFGLINRMLIPRSITFLRVVGVIVMLLNFVLLAKLLDYMLGQKFWGFLCVFLVALSPFAVVASVSGGSAAIATTLVLLFLMALYRNEYVFGGILSGVALAANLPGLIMFLIVVLDLLQNLEDKKKIVQRMLSASAGFFGVALLVYLYSLYTGSTKFFSVPLGDHDLMWPLMGFVPLIVVNTLNIAGIVYLISKKRYDVYKTHFHTMMMWISACALCIAQPSTLNLLFALTVSSVLGIFFLQGFASLWRVKLVPADTFVFMFAVLFLFGDLYANNNYVKNTVLSNCLEKNEVVDEVVAAVGPNKRHSMLVSNFAPAELSVKLGGTVYAVEGELLPIENFISADSSIIFVAKRKSNVDTLSTGCRALFNARYAEDKQEYSVQVIECRKGK